MINILNSSIPDTIVAMATPPGRGSVGIIRLSGPLAYSIAIEMSGGKSLTPKQVEYCSFWDHEKNLIDKGLIVYFKAPHSFTGEDIVEFQCHGSPLVLNSLLNESIFFGARLARAGEFSERAFLNNKIDLIQAEAIADLIAASSQTAARMAIRSLEGDFSKKINEINEQLIQLRLFIEAAMDFPEEDINFLSDGKVMALLNTLLEDLSAIRANANQGSMIREGLSVVMAGKPNAGKSTLINSLAEREVAIVTDIAGTTRDVIRESILLDDIPLHLIDTAGLRENSHDVVEKEGIKRTLQEINRADCLLMVIDINDNELIELNVTIRNALPDGIPVIKVFNKIDSLDEEPKKEDQTVYLSAKTKKGLSLLKDMIKESIGVQPTEGRFLARKRHLEALEKANSLLLAGREQLATTCAAELIAEDLRLAHQALCEITGEFSSDDLLGKIFSSFCIGK